MNPLTDREKAYVERAKREAGVAPDASPWDTPLGAESAFPETVIGWDNPAAEREADATGDKWAYIAAMIEQERADAHAERARRRRIVLSVTGAVAFAALIAGLQLFVA